MKFLKSDKFKNAIIILAKIALLLVITITIFILNYSQLYSPDDYTYSVVLGNFDDKIDSIQDLITNARYSYNNWTGRLIPHTLIGIFRNINPHIFEVVNTLVFMIFIVMIEKVLTKKSSFLGIATVFGYFTYAKMFGEKFSWISGSLNYLWPATMMVLLIYALYKNMYEEIKLNCFQKTLIVLYAFIVGFVHETTTFVMGSFLVCLYMLNLKKLLKMDIKDKVFYVLTFITFCLGAYFTIFAPGNFSRMGQSGNSIRIEVLKNYYENLGLILIVILSMAIMLVLKQKEIVLKELILFVLPVIIATIPMLVIGEFPERAFISFETLLAIVLSGNIVWIAEKYKDKEKTIACLSVIITLIIFGRFAPSTLAQIRYIIPYKYEVISILEANRGNPERVLIPEFKYYPWMHADDYINISNFFIDWREDLPINIYTAKNYNIGSVKCIAEDEYLVELTVDTPEDEYNTYVIWGIQEGERVREMSYYNHIEYPLKKDKLGIYKIDGSKNDLINKVLEIKMTTIQDGQIDTSNVKPEDLIFNKEKGVK